MTAWILAGVYVAVGVIVLIVLSFELQAQRRSTPFDLAEALSAALTWPIWLVAIIAEMSIGTDEIDD